MDKILIGEKFKLEKKSNWKRNLIGSNSYWKKILINQIILSRLVSPTSNHHTLHPPLTSITHLHLAVFPVFFRFFPVFPNKIFFQLEFFSNKNFVPPIRICFSIGGGGGEGGGLRTTTKYATPHLP